MEERKRPSPYDQNEAAPPLKRQATNANGASKSHADTDMPWKDDLERFQKDAILRQMQEYKRERNTLETTLKELRKKARDHDDHLRIIDSWLKQLIDEVKLMVPSDEDHDMNDSLPPSSLLFPDQEQFEKHLESRAEDIRSLVSRVFGKDNHAPPEVTGLQSRISQLLAVEKEHLVELESLRNEVKDLDERLQSASLRYMVAEKKLDRAKSVTAAKLEKGLILGGSKPGSEDAGQGKREDGGVNGVADHGEEVAELEQEVKKSVAASEKQKEQIGKLEEENAKLTAKTTEITTKFTLLTDEDYAKTDLYKQLKSQHDDVVVRLNNLEAVNVELKDENTKFSGERTSYQTQLENEARNAIAEKDSLLGSAEANLARIRSSRDELLADQAIRKATLEQDHDALKKTKELTAAHEERIKALESENERLSMQPGNMMAEASEIDSLGAEELRMKYMELDKKYQLLTSELTSMQTAFQKTSKLANQKVSELSSLEEKVVRLAAEKSKADQKFFAAMKSKETRDGEVRTLRLQNTKSSEVVSSLKEAEASSRALIATLEKQLAEMKDNLHVKTNEHRSAAQQATQQNTELTRTNAQLTELKQQLSVKDSKLATTLSACRSAEVEVEELKSSLADTRKNLESWKNKSGQSEQYEMLRMLAYCGVCKKNLKSTALKTCGHLFCEGCVEERIQSRSRKCPNCGKPFGINDHMRITL